MSREFKLEFICGHFWVKEIEPSLNFAPLPKVLHTRDYISELAARQRDNEAKANKNYREYEASEDCWLCDGKGVLVDSTCDQCGGRGWQRFLIRENYDNEVLFKEKLPYKR